MSDDNSQPLLPRSIIRQHIPGHSEGLQQDIPLWQHLSMSQPQPATGVQAVPVGIGFANRPQQQIWPDHTSQFSQRGWQPLPQPHTQQSPQESQDLTPQVVRSQHQNWQGAGDVNPLPLQQIQHLIWLQQQQQQQQQLHQQLQHHSGHHQSEPNLHHVDSLGQHDDLNHDKFTKSPSPQVDETRHSPLTRPYVQTVTSPQQQLWQHPQILHQYDVQQHSESPHSQGFQHTPTPAVSHHQPLFTPQQQYVQPMWQHAAPYSQVQLQHLRQSTPPMQQHLLWQQQQQQQQQQQMQQIQQSQTQSQSQSQSQQLQQPNSESASPYSPPSSHFPEKPTFPEKREETRSEPSTSFLGNRLTSEPLTTSSNKIKPFDSPVNSVSNIGLTSSASPLSLSGPPTTSTSNQIRILSKNSQSTPTTSDVFTSQNQKTNDSFPSNTSSSSPQNLHQRPNQANQGGLFNLNNVNTPPPQRPQNFNPNPTGSPYQNLNPQNMANKNFTGLYGNPNRFQAPNRDHGLNSVSPGNQFRPRSPNIRSQQPNSFVPNMLQRGPNIQPGPTFTRMDHIEVNIFVSGLNPRTNAESVRRYFEFAGRPSQVKDHVIFGIDHTDALITFQQKPDFMKVRQNVRNRKLDGFSLEVCEVPPPRCIVVSSDVPVHSQDSLVSYFEKESVGGGTLKKNGIDETEDGCCILEFEDYRAVQRLCAGQRQHRVDGILLRVSPYYKCENGSVWDTSLHMVPVPKPVNIQILPDQLEFVKRQCQAQFSTRMREKFAEVTYSKDHVTVKCTLRQSMPNYRMLVRGWETGVQEAVAKFLGGTIDQADVAVPDIIWDKFLEWLNAGHADSKDIHIKQDRERKRLKLVGFKGSLKTVNHLISQKVETLSRVARRKIETRKVKSTEKLVVLELQGSINALCRKFGDMKIHIDGNEVTIEGDPTDIPNAYKEIYTECDKIEPYIFKHTKSREYVMFCKKESSRKFIQRRLDQKMIKGAWSISGSEISVYTHRKIDSEAIKNAIQDCVQEELINVEKTSNSLLNSEVWGDFVSDKTRRYKDRVEIYVRKQQSVLVVGTCEVIHNLVQLVKDFLDEKTTKTVLVSCDPVILDFISACWTDNDFNDIQKCDVQFRKKANGLELTGLSEKLIAAKQKLDTKLKRLCSKKHPIKKVGIHEVMDTLRNSGTLGVLERECKCVMRLPPEMDRNSPPIGNQFEAMELAVSSDAGAGQGSKKFHTKNHNIKIHLVFGELSAQKADVLVCNAASNLNLKSGSASYSLAKAGGNQLQVDCNKLYPDGISEGDVAVIDGGNLHCDQVYLTALPGWKEAVQNGGSVLRQFMREALRQADLTNMKSICMPALGAGGYLGYPRDVVARIIYGAVTEFDASYNKTSLKEISIVCYAKESETIKAIEDQETMRMYGSIGTGPLSTDFVKGRIRIELVIDDLSQQKVDAYLCSVATDMNLTRNAVCKSLVEIGGKSLQEECKQKYNNELAAGKVVDITGSHLPCKTIYLTVLPTFTDPSLGEKNMVGILQTTLQLANLKGYTSIALPILGTGNCNYPKHVSAKCMYEATLDWAAKNPKASLKLVRFVMFSKDTEAQQAFRSYHLKIQGKELRSSRSLYGDSSINSSKSVAAKYRMIQNGCDLGSIQLKVQIGDILKTPADILVNPVGPNFDMSGKTSQALVKQYPNILPECQQKKSELRRDGIVVTGASELKVKYVLHALNQDSMAAWRNKLTACLEEANKRSATSMVFPLLGTGPGSRQFSVDSMAECLFCAVDDFSNKMSKISVKEVKVVIAQSSPPSVKATMLSTFQEKITSTLTPSTPSKWHKKGPTERPGSNQHSARHRGPPDLMLSVHSDAIVNIDRCIRLLDDKVALEYCKKTLDVEVTTVKTLSDKQIDNILDSNLQLEIKLDRKNGKFSLHGPFRSVLTATDTIQTRLKVYSSEQKNKSEAETLACQVRWHFEEPGTTNTAESKEVPYDIMVNLVLEKAFLAGKSSVELIDTDRRVYVVDLQKLVEYLKDSKSDIVRVIRKDVMKIGDIPVPSNWMSMSNNENVKKVTLATNDREYQKVEKQLLTQLRTGVQSNKIKNKQNIQVLKIERIQNRSVHQHYACRKKVMDQQKSGKQVERQLWHCTTEEIVPSIIAHGFNRSYCGTSGASYGQGVYLSGDASYTVQQNGSSSKPGSKRHIFMVKALTGETMKGNPNLRVLPPVNPSQRTVLYDSAVDDVKKPMEFVIFHDAQAYPEYLITFSM